MIDSQTSQGLTLTDLLAIIGAIAGTLGTVLALMAIGWDFYKWRYNETVQLEVSAFPNFASTANTQIYIRVMVTNIGKIATTVKLISVQGFDSKPKRTSKKYEGKDLGIINPAIGSLPVKLNPSDDADFLIFQNFEGIEKFRKYQYLYFRIEDSVSKRKFGAAIKMRDIK